MKKALITGATGFVGYHLTRELETNGYEVHRTSHLGFDHSMQMDITSFNRVRSTLRRISPDFIFHLAGIAYVPSSWQSPELVFHVNTLGTLNLFDAVRSIDIDPVIQIAGSSEEYGLVTEKECPVNEDQPLRPLSPYAVSKIAMDFLGYQYFKTYGMKIIRTRAFNHEGWGRGEQYMTSTFAKQVAEIKLGLRSSEIYHGNLESKRDITDVKDMVRAYRLAVEMCEPGEVYNIGSGIAYSALDILLKLCGLAKIKNPAFKEDVKRMRPSDVPLLLCDSNKFREITGWKPERSIEETLTDSINYWMWRYQKNDLGKSEE